MSNSYDDNDDDEDYFSEVDEGDDTGKEPRFVKLDQLNILPTTLADMKVDELFSTFIALRNQLATDRKGYKSREAKVKSQMQTISSVLLNKSLGLGVTALSGATGSGYQQSKERLKIAPDGWMDFCNWLLETRNFHTLQKRVSPDAVKEVRDTTGSLPPGVESSTELTFVVRSPTARKAKT